MGWFAKPLEDFAEEVELCVLGTKLEFRGTCGPRHARARVLSTQQREHWRWAWGWKVLSSRAGGCAIVANFRSTSSARTEAGIWEHFMTYLFRCHQSRYEPMPTYILRDSLLRERATKATKVVDVQLEDILRLVTDGKRGKPRQSRISIMNLWSNVYTYDAVPRAFRQSVGDKELWPCTQWPREKRSDMLDESDRQEEEGDDAACGAHGNRLGDDQVEEIDEDILDSLMNDDMNAVSGC